MFRHELEEPKNIEELLIAIQRELKEVKLQIDGLQMVYQKLYLIQIRLENIQDGDKNGS